jgi:N6-adenosine-specific RNA methylase IME4
MATYVLKVLEKFNMDKSYSARTHMVVRALEKDKDPFRPKEGEEVLGQEYSYLCVIGALMYLANNTRPGIAFTVNCLARRSVAPTMCNWNDTIDLGLYFHKIQESKLIGYADTGYLSDPRNARSQA